jgi:hypothetical protein
MPSPGALRQSRDEVPSVSSQRPCIGPYTWFATESFSGGMLDLVDGKLVSDFCAMACPTRQSSPFG